MSVSGFQLLVTAVEPLLVTEQTSHGRMTNERRWRSPDLEAVTMIPRPHSQTVVDEGQLLARHPPGLS